MVDSARDLFIERGYDSVTLAEIVRRSGGSLSTLYELFSNKQGLLGAVVASQKSNGLARIREIVARELPPFDTLSAIARAVHDDLADPGIVGLMRVVMAEGLRNPAFSQIIYDTAHLPLQECLTSLFERLLAAGHIHVVRPDLAAEIFLGMVVHSAQMRALFCDTAACAAVRDDTIRLAVALFARGIGITPPA